MAVRCSSLKDLGAGAWRVHSSTPTKSKPSTQRSRQKRVPGLMPQELLWYAVKVRWPAAEKEVSAMVPDRRFRIDIAFVRDGLAVEVDGFAHHGKFLKDFKRDRERQNLLTLVGWRILRFSAGEVRKDLLGCLSMIERCLSSPPLDCTLNSMPPE